MKKFLAPAIAAACLLAGLAPVAASAKDFKEIKLSLIHISEPTRPY